MPDDQMQDAHQVYTAQPSPEDNTSPVISEATQTSKPPLPAYADPSFYSALPTPPLYTPAPERPSSPQRSYTYASSPRPERTRSSRSSSFWRMVRQFPRQYWRVLTKPSVLTFYYEEGKATWGALWTQLIGFGILNALVFICSILAIAFMDPLLAGNLSTTTILSIGSFLQGFLIFGILAAIFTILGYFFNAGVFYLFARLFGGRASFLEHCYCTALIVIPIWAISFILISSSLFLIPAFSSSITSIIGIVGFAYGAILQIFMIMAIHRLNWSRAAAAVVITIIILSAGILPFVFIPQ